jgi:hypothetical protein
MSTAVPAAVARPQQPRPQAPPTLLFIPEIRAMLEEGRALTPDDYRRIAVTLRVSLTTATTSDNSVYRVFGTHKMLITGIRGHLVLTSPSGDSAIGIANFTTNLKDVRELKAMNCRITFINQDDSTNILGENLAIALSTLMPSAGGEALDWRNAPHIVPPGATVQMTATLITTVSPYVGNATEYGITVDATLVRVAAS